MRLTTATAEALIEILPDLVSAAEETQEAAEAWLNMDGCTTRDEREERAEYREQYEGIIEELMAAAYALADLLPARGGMR